MATSNISKKLKLHLDKFLMFQDFWKNELTKEVSKRKSDEKFKLTNC